MNPNKKLKQETSKLFTIKYIPNNYTDLVIKINKKITEETINRKILTIIKNYDCSKIVLLSGLTGIGKTCLISLIVKKYTNYNLVYLDNYSTLNQIIKNTNILNKSKSIIIIKLSIDDYETKQVN